jgi:hypothetical protein
MAFSRVMRSSAYNSCGATKKSALCECGITAKKSCKNGRKGGKKIPERTVGVLSGTNRACEFVVGLKPDLQK